MIRQSIEKSNNALSKRKLVFNSYLNESSLCAESSLMRNNHLRWSYFATAWDSPSSVKIGSLTESFDSYRPYIFEYFLNMSIYDLLFMSHRTIAAHIQLPCGATGISTRTVQRHLKELESVGLIKVVYRHMHTNYYELSSAIFEQSSKLIEYFPSLKNLINVFERRLSHITQHQQRVLIHASRLLKKYVSVFGLPSIKEEMGVVQNKKEEDIYINKKKVEQIKESALYKKIKMMNDRIFGNAPPEKNNKKERFFPLFDCIKNTQREKTPIASVEPCTSSIQQPPIQSSAVEKYERMKTTYINNFGIYQGTIKFEMFLERKSLGQKYNKLK